MIAPLTLSRLVVAPITAPAVAPITASRLVLRIGSAAGAGARLAVVRAAGVGARYTGCAWTGWRTGTPCGV
jgi:hypothetical protein